MPKLAPQLLNRFIRDDRGVFAVVFAVLGVVLIGMAGAVVDYAQVEQVRARGQIALDSAALGLHQHIGTKTETQLKATAQALLDENIGDLKVNAKVDSVKVNTDTGQLLLTAQVTVPMSFVALVGIENMTASILSQVTRKRSAVEVAFVLDNSGSMGGDKIAKLKTAAANAVKILFYGTKSPDSKVTKNPHTRVAVVPFSFLVNVGASYKDATWIDRAGGSSIANDNFDDDDDDGTPFTGKVDRIALIESMAGESWKGCVESRVYPGNVDDTTPNVSLPDTLFTPSFAPDEPGAAGSPDSGFNNSYIDDAPPSCDVDAGTCVCTTKKKKTSCSYVDPKGKSKSCSCPSGLSSCTIKETPSGLSQRELQERLCKYPGAKTKDSPDSSRHEKYTQGPNGSCPNSQIQPLTDDVTAITSKIHAMVADGGTNIHEGTAWGFRVLSPSEPFTEGQPYGKTSKVLIVMTDGENTYWHVNRRYDRTDTPNMNGTYYYTAYGYQYNERLTMNGKGPYKNADGDALQLKMDGLTTETCANAKKAGITIYTIGLEVPNKTTKAMLTACASDTGKAYFPEKASELDGVFAAIAGEMSELRLEK